MFDLEKIHLRKCFEAQGRRCVGCLRTFKSLNDVILGQNGFICFDCCELELEKMFKFKNTENGQQVH